MSWYLHTDYVVILHTPKYKYHFKLSRESKVKSYILFVRNLLPLCLVCKKSINTQKIQLRKCACQFQINMVNWFHCFKVSNVFTSIAALFYLWTNFKHISKPLHCEMCVLDFLELVTSAASRVLTRTLLTVDFLSAVKSLLLCLKNKK